MLGENICKVHGLQFESPIMTRKNGYIWCEYGWKKTVDTSKKVDFYCFARKNTLFYPEECVVTQVY